MSACVARFTATYLVAPYRGHRFASSDRPKEKNERKEHTESKCRNAGVYILDGQSIRQAPCQRSKVQPPYQTREKRKGKKQCAPWPLASRRISARMVPESPRKLPQARRSLEKKESKTRSAGISVSVRSKNDAICSRRIELDCHQLASATDGHGRMGRGDAAHDASEPCARLCPHHRTSRTPGRTADGVTPAPTDHIGADSSLAQTGAASTRTSGGGADHINQSFLLWEKADISKLDCHLFALTLT